MKASSDYARVERAIRYLQAHVHEQPSLAEVAEEIGLSEFHFQRLFQRWAGVSPKRFLQVLTVEEAKGWLATSSVLVTSHAVGLSGPSRLHDLFLSLEKLTPGEYKSRARGLTLRYGVEETPFGPALFARLDRGLAGVSFLQDGGAQAAVSALQARWPLARLEAAPAAVRGLAETFCARLRGDASSPLSLVLKGTELQLKIWEALLRVEPGSVVSYATLAAASGAPGAVRAVSTAVGFNPIAALIPCHRVLRSTGALGGYAWGLPRKAALLGLERTRHQTLKALDIPAL